MAGIRDKISRNNRFFEFIHFDPGKKGVQWTEMKSDNR